MEDARLCCRHCGAVLPEIDIDQEIVICPYCRGANQVADLLGDSDAVRIEKIRARTKAHLEAMRLKEEAKRKRMEAMEKRPHFTCFSDLIWNFLPYLLGLAAFLCLAVTVYAFAEPKAYWAGGIGIVQALLLGTAAFLGDDHRTRKLASLFTVLALVLTIPWWMCMEAGENRADDPIDWQALFMGEELPVPEKCFGSVSQNNEKRLDLELYGQEPIDYRNYSQACKEFGYSLDRRDLGFGWKAYNEKGAKLDLSYREDKKILELTLYAPLDFQKLQWPEGDLGTLIPKPDADKGVANWAYEDKFSLYVGGMTEKAYGEYVKVLKSLGFAERYHSSFPYTFSGENSEGVKVRADYEGFETMILELWLPYEKKE